MFKIYNNVEDKIVFHGNERELIDFVSKIRYENGDFYMGAIWGIGDAIDYIEYYCDNLEFKYY